MADTESNSAQASSSTQPAAVLKRRRRFTIEVPGLGPVTYSRGEEVPEAHYEHVKGRDRRWFETIEEGEGEASEGDADDE